jgi:hypothetical protein
MVLDGLDADNTNEFPIQSGFPVDKLANDLPLNLNSILPQHETLWTGDERQSELGLSEDMLKDLLELFFYGETGVETRG